MVRAMTAIVDVVLPVFAIMLAGYLAGRLRLLGDASSEALNGFVYYGAMPALFFVSMSSVPLAEAFDGPFLAAFGGGMAITFLTALLVGRLVFPNRLGALGLQGVTAIFANTGYLGIPLLITAFGDTGKLPAIITTVLNGTLVLGLAVVLLELDQSRGAGPLRVLRNVTLGVLKSPLVLSAGAGLLASGLALEIPRPVITFGNIMGAAAGPCALFAIGLFLVGRAPKAGAFEVGWLVLLKLVVQPLVTWWLAFEVFALEPTLAAIAVILSALPTGALVFVLAQQYNIYVQRSTAAILASTVLSVVTLSLLFASLDL